MAAQHLAGVPLERRPVEVVDVAEDPRLGRLGVAPRQDLERVRVRDGQHVGLLDAGEAVDRGAIERHPVLERVLQLGRADGEALEVAEDVGEPQPHEAHAALLDAPQHIRPLLLQHGHRSSLLDRGGRQRSHHQGAGGPRHPRRRRTSSASRPFRSRCRPCRPSGGRRRKDPCWRWAADPRGSPGPPGARPAGCGSRRPDRRRRS